MLRNSSACAPDLMSGNNGVIGTTPDTNTEKCGGLGGRRVTFGRPINCFQRPWRIESGAHLVKGPRTGSGAASPSFEPSPGGIEEFVLPVPCPPVMVR